MVDLRAAWNRPGLFILPPAHTEAFPGLFSLGDLVEDPAGSGLYPFTTIGATIPVLTAHPGDVPFVDVFIDVVPDGVDRLTVWRQQDDRWMPVRGAVGVRNVGAWTGHDFEAGFDRTLTYRVQYYQEDGTALGFSDTNTVTLAGPGGDWVWVHDPLDPSTSLKVMMVDGFGRQITRPNPGGFAYPRGSSVGISLPGVRRGVDQVPLDVFTVTRSEGEAFNRMVGGYDEPALGVLCFRTRRETWLPGTLFAAVTVNLQPYGSSGDLVLWGVTGTETAPPVPTVVAPDLTYTDFTAAYSTYAEFASTYGSYIEAQRDYTVKEG